MSPRSGQPLNPRVSSRSRPDTRSYSATAAQSKLGFNDVAEAALCRPPLTTIATTTGKIGEIPPNCFWIESLARRRPVSSFYGQVW